MLVKLDSKIPDDMKIKAKQLNLPTHIRDLRDAARFGIDGYTVYRIHYLDLQLLILNFYIENVNKAIFELNRANMRERGISRIVEASEADFDSL